MASLCKVLLISCCAAALLAVAFAAEVEPSTLQKAANAPRRILRGYAHAWSNRYYGGNQWGWPGSYGWGGMSWGWPYQENRWVSASRMDNSVERRFNMASK